MRSLCLHGYQRGKHPVRQHSIPSRRQSSLIWAPRALRGSTIQHSKKPLASPTSFASVKMEGLLFNVNNGYELLLLLTDVQLLTRIL